MHFNCSSKGFKRIYSKKESIKFLRQKKNGGLGSGKWSLAYGKSIYKNNNEN